MRVFRLSIDHLVGNEDENLRLAQLGIDLDKAEAALPNLANSYTRCLGCQRLKGGFKEVDDFRQVLEVLPDGLLKV